MSQKLSYKEEHFGNCPVCGFTEGYLNVHSSHWFHCKTHKTKWHVGFNLFSSWKNESPEVTEKNAILLSTYTEVEPEE